VVSVYRPVEGLSLRQALDEPQALLLERALDVAQVPAPAQELSPVAQVPAPAQELSPVAQVPAPALVSAVPHAANRPLRQFVVL
jgi:hypothetical protein